MATTRYTVIDGEILSENRAGIKRDYVPDPLGSTLALIDNTQTQTDTFSYYPYGEVASRTGTTATPFQYLGTLGYYQDNSGRTYVRARVLDTAHGRWMTQDPIGFDGGDWNLYRYVGNRPNTMTDSTGLKVFICCARKLGVSGHCFVSTNKCGAYGQHWEDNLIWGRGIVDQDNEYLLPVDPKEPPSRGRITIPGRGGSSEGWPVTCRPVSKDPNFEAAICRCMERSQTNPPNYILPIQNCQHWVGMMLDCACGPGKAWTGDKCVGEIPREYLPIYPPTPGMAGG